MTAKELARFQQLAQFQHEEYGRWLQLLADVQGKPIAAPDPQGAPAPVVVAGNAGGAVVELKTTSTRTWRDVAAGNDSGWAALSKAMQRAAVAGECWLAAWEQKGSWLDVGSDVPGGGAA